MAKKKLATGDTLVCVPCGAEYVVTNLGTAYAEAWCCGVPLKGRAAGAAAPARKAAPRKAAPKKPAGRKPAARKAAPKRKR